jgi:2-oxo-3-hexenedioate decarboxylase
VSLQGKYGAIERELLAAQAEARAIAPFSSRDPAFDSGAAYAVAKGILDARVRRGERPIGRKVGFTNRNIWGQYGVSTPIWAHMYDTTVRFAPDNSATVPLARFVSPRIEPEIAFGFAKAPSEKMSAAELLGCIEWIAHAFEIVDSVFPGWKFAAADTIAAFGLHGALIVGEKIPVAGKDGLAAKLRSFRISLARNGAVQDRGTGANVLDSPLLALRHFLALLATQPAFAPLAPGEIVTTGTLTAALPVMAGETWSTAFEGIEVPGLTLRFD